LKWWSSSNYPRKQSLGQRLSSQAKMKGAWQKLEVVGCIDLITQSNLENSFPESIALFTVFASSVVYLSLLWSTRFSVHLFMPPYP
jgi:hypothetical protein